MRKTAAKVMGLVLFAVSSLTALAGCGENDAHEHVFDGQVATAEYLKSGANCASAAKYYYSCSICGKAGEMTFSYGEKGDHIYDGSLKEVFQEATCAEPAHYYQRCIVCKEKGNEVYIGTELTEHTFTAKSTNYSYIKTDATATSPAEYYYSCAVCGAKGTQTFSAGKTLTEYAREDKTLYTPTSLTVSMYDAENSVYGFTYNSKSLPVSAVLQIQEGTTLTDACEQYGFNSVEASSLVDDGTQTSTETMTYYISKTEIALKPNTTYTYRVGEKYLNTYTETVTITANDPSATSFKFAHVSDSQTQPKNSREAYYGQVLEQIITNENDFVVHTGDTVEYGKYEALWEKMLNGNFAQLSRIPVMAVSGNHETLYEQGGTSETFKHYNYKLPEQESTEKGFFYSFKYGNVKFIMINTNDVTGNKLKDEQYNWIVKELSDDSCTWKIVAMHCPLYSAGTYGADPARNAPTLTLQAQLKGVFAKYGVDLVLQGHDHLIQRTYPIGADGKPLEEDIREEGGIEYSYNPLAPIYVMNGPTTEQTRNPYTDGNGYNTSLFRYAESSKVRSWAEFTVSGNSLLVSVKHLTDSGATEVYHTWGIKKA